MGANRITWKLESSPHGIAQVHSSHRMMPKLQAATGVSSANLQVDNRQPQVSVQPVPQCATRQGDRDLAQQHRSMYSKADPAAQAQEQQALSNWRYGS